MKYYTFELWGQINSECEDIRNNAERQWDINAKQYFNIYNKIKPRLPKGFIHIFEKEKGFHDWKIKNIAISHVNNKIIVVEILIADNRKSYCISYKGIKKFYLITKTIVS